MPSRKRSTSPAHSLPPPKRFGSPSTPISPFASTFAASTFEWLDSIGDKQSVFHAKFGDPVGSTKVACFDFMGTLVQPRSFARDPQDGEDWKWLEETGQKGKDNRARSVLPPIVSRLRSLHEAGYTIVIFGSNIEFTDDFDTIVQAACTDLDVPIQAFFSTGFDAYRLPCVGMWVEFEKNWNDGEKINLKESFYVSSASGLGRLDYGRKFAFNIPFKFYTPQHYFFGEEYDNRWSLGGFNPKKYDNSGPLFLPTSSPLRSRQFSEFDDPVAEVILFVGRPASGKTFFYNRIFKKYGYERITSIDTYDLSRSLRSNPTKTLFVIDLSLPSRSSRHRFIDAFKQISKERTSSTPPLPPFKIRCFNFVVPEEIAKHNNQFAELWDKTGGTEEGRYRSFTDEEKFQDWRMDWEVPTSAEGFDEIKEIYFRFDVNYPSEAIGKARSKNWKRFGDYYLKEYEMPVLYPEMYE